MKQASKEGAKSGNCRLLWIESDEVWAERLRR